MTETLLYLFHMAIALSGLQPMEPPTTKSLPYAEMLNVVCEDVELKSECKRQTGLQAAYMVKTHKILYRDDLNIDDSFDNSFLVHEYVHALQAHEYGDEIFDTCKSVFLMEKQAYGVQQSYLNKVGTFARVGDKLRFFHCPDED